MLTVTSHTLNIEPRTRKLDWRGSRSAKKVARRIQMWPFFHFIRKGLHFSIFPGAFGKSWLRVFACVWADAVASKDADNSVPLSPYSTVAWMKGSDKSGSSSTSPAVNYKYCMQAKKKKKLAGCGPITKRVLRISGTCHLIWWNRINSAFDPSDPTFSSVFARKSGPQPIRVAAESLVSHLTGNNK